MEKAAAANDAGMRAGLDATRAGASENDVAAAIMNAAIKAGSEYLGMDPFVTSGPRSGVPHTTWRRRKIEPGDLVALETCACYNRYHAALFRTVAVGKIPQLAARHVQDLRWKGSTAAIEKLKPGNTCADVHNACQAVIDRHGFTGGYRKRTGYSIGISFAPDWGEGNILEPLSRRRRAARARHGVSRAGRAARIRQVHGRGERDRGGHRRRRAPARPHRAASCCGCDDDGRSGARLRARRAAVRDARQGDARCRRASRARPTARASSSPTT